MTGKEVREIREELGLTQEELAREIGLTYQRISCYEREERSPPKVVEAFLRHLRICRIVPTRTKPKTGR